MNYRIVYVLLLFFSASIIKAAINSAEGSVFDYNQLNLRNNDDFKTRILENREKLDRWVTGKKNIIFEEINDTIDYAHSHIPGIDGGWLPEGFAHWITTQPGILWYQRKLVHRKLTNIIFKYTGSLGASDMCNCSMPRLEFYPKVYHENKFDPWTFDRFFKQRFFKLSHGLIKIGLGCVAFYGSKKVFESLKIDHIFLMPIGYISLYCIGTGLVKSYKAIMLKSRKEYKVKCLRELFYKLGSKENFILEIKEYVNTKITNINALIARNEFLNGEIEKIEQRHREDQIKYSEKEREISNLKGQKITGENYYEGCILSHRST